MCGARDAVTLKTRDLLLNDVARVDGKACAGGCVLPFLFLHRRKKRGEAMRPVWIIGQVLIYVSCLSLIALVIKWWRE